MGYVSPAIETAGPTAARPPGVASLRERKKAQQRERIIDVAVGLFREKGYEATRVDDIVGRLDISQPTFFRYFPSKDAVLREVGFRACDCMIDKLKTGARDVSVADRLRRLYQNLATHTQADRPLWRAVVLADAMDAVRSPEFRAPKQVWLDLLARMLADGQERGEFRADMRAAEAAEHLDALYSSVVSRWAVELGGAAPLPRRVGDLIEFFLRAIQTAEL
jgi:AcrR family transcriptional regulator